MLWNLSLCSLKCPWFKCCPGLDVDHLEITPKYHFSFLSTTGLIGSTVKRDISKSSKFSEECSQKGMLCGLRLDCGRLAAEPSGGEWWGFCSFVSGYLHSTAGKSI